MNEETKIMLESEIQAIIESLGTIDPTTKEYEMASEALSRLYKLKNESEKTELTHLEAIEAQEQNIAIEEAKVAIEEAKVAESKKGRWANLLITGLIFVAGCLFDGYWNAKGLEFEETGIWTSQTVRNHKQHQNHRKKL